MGGGEHHTKLRSAGLAALLVVATSLGVYALGVRRDPGRTLFSQAENNLAVGNYDSAARDYLLLAERLPRSSWAPQALFKAAYVLGTQLGRPEEAAARYRELARKYPNDPLAGEALLSAARVYESNLRRYDQATTLYKQVASRPGAASSQIADGRLGVLRCLAAQGNPQTVEAATGFLSSYQGRAEFKLRCAEAMYVLAKYYQEAVGRPRDAVRVYKQLAERFPKTAWATRAEQEMAWINYHVLSRPGGTPRRVALELPPVIQQGAAPEGDLCLISLCQVLWWHGWTGGVSDLETMSGAAFSAFFEGSEGDHLVSQTYLVNPLVTACDALGVRCEYVLLPSVDALAEKVKAYLRTGRPVITVAGPPISGWVVVTGFDLDRRDFYVANLAGGNQAVPGLQMRAAWGLASQGIVLWGEPTRPGYLAFVASPRGSLDHWDRTRAARLAVKRAAEIGVHRAERRGTRAAGLSALEMAAERFSAAARDPRPKDWLPLAAWAANNLALLRARRAAAAQFLEGQAALFPGACQPYLRQAATRYHEAEKALGDLARDRPWTSWGPQGPASPPLAQSLGKCAEAMRAAAAAEKAALAGIEAALKALG